jgi:membrane-bound serine protease (ClpP class)
MSRKTYFIFSIITGLLKGAILVSIVFWLLPLWEIHIPMWGFILIFIAFFAFEIITFRLGKRSLESRPAMGPEVIVGCCGKATTPLNPDGYVQVNGELWHAFSSDVNINEGDSIIVVGLDRLNLYVSPSRALKNMG